MSEVKAYRQGLFEGAITERKRITDIVHIRIGAIQYAIDDLKRNDVEVPLTLYGSTNELRLLLRDIEKEQIECRGQ